MGQFALSLADTRLIQHLQRGGQLGDPAGLGLVRGIVAHTLGDRGAGEAARAAGFDEASLVQIYVAATEAIMPEPLIRHGKDIIATSLAFQDFGRFPVWLRIITEEGRLRPPQDLLLITANAEESVKELHRRARDLKPVAPIAASRSGCLMLAFGAVGVGVGAAGMLVV